MNHHPHNHVYTYKSKDSNHQSKIKMAKDLFEKKIKETNKYSLFDQLPTGGTQILQLLLYLPLRFLTFYQFKLNKCIPVLVRSFRYISSRLLPDELLLNLSCKECRRAPTMHQNEKFQDNQSNYKTNLQSIITTYAGNNSDEMNLLNIHTIAQQKNK